MANNNIDNEIISMQGIVKFGKSVKDQFSHVISELKEVDTYLTKISKTNSSLSKSALAQIADDSFATASKYGKTAAAYLSLIHI